ncbi:MAG: GNAT family N-acetyltransferase [Dermatophilaceae bacterium]
MSDSRYAVRPLRVHDTDELGRVHVQVWREAYAAHMPADYLEALDPVKSAERWRLRFEMEEPDGVVVVATGPDGGIVGFASAGPTRDEDAPTEWELYAINVLVTHHGSGVADQLIIAALAQRPATLWVVTDNARAQAFYRRHGFSLEGATKVHESTGTPEIRMIRRSASKLSV